MENYPLGKMLDTLDWLPPIIQLKPAVLPDGFIDSLRSWCCTFVNWDTSMTGLKFTNFKNFIWLRYVFPASPILITVRHPIDNYISFKHWEIKHECHPPTPRQWFMERYPRADKSLLSVDNKLVVYFEDMVHNPQQVADRCFDFIGVGSHTLDFSNNHEVYASVTSLPEGETSTNSLQTAVTTRRLDRSLISQSEIDELSRCVISSGLLNTILSPYKDDFN